MKPKHISFVLALLASSSLHAQEGPPPEGHRPPPPPLITALDTNKDHVISAEEIAAAPTSLLTLDADGDGALSKDEIRPKPPATKPTDDPENTTDSSKEPKGPPPEEDGKQRPVPPLMAALDTDKDGTLSSTEIQKAAESLKTLDKNGDGQLTHDELRPPRPEGGPHRGHGPGPGGPRGGRPPGPPAPPEDGTTPPADEAESQ